MLPSAVGVAISPLPIVAVVLMLLTPLAKVNGLAFVLGWLFGMAVVGGTALLLTNGAGATSEDEPATWIGLLKLMLGALLLILAAVQWQKRPAPNEEPEMPHWMSALESFTPWNAGGTAAFLAGINPKNLLLIIAGVAAIAQTGISSGEQALAYIIFILIGTIGVAIPVAIYFLLGDRAAAILIDVKDWMAQNNAAIMAVLFVILGVKLIGDAISGLT
jgi:hypothetical protein